MKKKPNLKRRKQNKPAPAPLPDRPPVEFTLAYWMRQADLVESSRKLQATTDFKYLLGLLYGQIPSGFPVRGEPVTDIQVAVEHGRIEGYLDCLKVIKASAILAPKGSEPVESTFGADKYE